MGQVKGSAITARIRFVRERFGESGYRRVHDALSPEHRALLDARVLPHAWVPYDFFIALNVEIDRMFGAGDLASCVEMGRFAADVNLPTLYRIFYKLGSPLYIMQKAAKVWAVHYDSGELQAAEDGPNAVRLRIDGFAEPHRAHCLSVLGWAARSIEISGATLLSADEPLCRARGEEACEMILKWR